MDAIRDVIYKSTVKVFGVVEKIYGGKYFNKATTSTAYATDRKLKAKGKKEKKKKENILNQ